MHPIWTLLFAVTSEILFKNNGGDIYQFSEKFVDSLQKWYAHASETMEKLSELHTFQKPENYAATSLSRLEFPGNSCELGMKGL